MEGFFYAFITVILLGGQIMMGILLYQWHTGQQKTQSTRSEILELREFISQLRNDNRGLAKELNKLRNDFDLRELYGKDSSVYFDAIERARDGASPADLSNEYGIEKTEADLIVHTHQPLIKAA